ncbi:helix-turn-helix domain-containing protein [Lutimonas halocynthiae]
MTVVEATVRNRIKGGDLPAEKIGRRMYVKRSDLEKSMEEVRSLKFKR